MKSIINHFYANVTIFRWLRAYRYVPDAAKASQKELPTTTATTMTTKFIRLQFLNVIREQTKTPHRHSERERVAHTISDEVSNRKT